MRPMEVVVTLPVFKRVLINSFLASPSSIDRDWREVQVAKNMHTDGVIENDRWSGELGHWYRFISEELIQFESFCRLQL